MSSAAYITLQLARFDAIRPMAAFSRALEYDPSTVTFWYSLKAMTDFAYGPGIHSHQMGQQADQHLADRISSCRCVFVRSEGTWYGTDPSRLRAS